MSSGRIEALGDVRLLELDGVWGGEADHLGNPALLHEPANDRPLAAVESRLDPRVVADGHEGGLDRAHRAVGVFHQVDIAVVDVHPHHPAGGAHHAFRNEVAHDPRRTGIPGTDPPHADVDDWRAVAFQGGRLQDGLVGGMIHLAQRHLGIEPLGVLLVSIKDVGLPDKPIVDQGLGVLHPGAVPEGEPQLGEEAPGPGKLGGPACVPEVIRHRLLAEHVFAGRERRHGQLEVRVRGRGDIDDVEGRVTDGSVPVVADPRDAELPGRVHGALPDHVTEERNLAPWVPLPAGEVRRPCPSARSQDPDPEDACLHGRKRGSSASRRPSPRRLIASTAIMMASPGNAVIHHATRR